MIGQTLGHYRIVEKIGAGGMGEVYRARDTHLNRDVAVKVLPAGVLGDEYARKRFRKEAETLSKLNHPHLATVHDFDTQEGVDFLVMEYVPGQTLVARLRGDPLPEKEVGRIGMQVAEALEEAHEQGVVHRDLKPGNIALTAKGQVKVLDFGIAKLLQPSGVAATTESLTQSLAVAGTLPYMAPEQLQGAEVDGRADIYALGSLLYEMATGRRPFAEREPSRLLAAVLGEAPPAPRNLSRQVSPELERIILKCLEKDPTNRHQSAKELAVDLRRLTAPSTLRPAASPPPSRGRRLRWAAAVVVPALLLAALIGWNVGGLRQRFFGGVAPGQITSIAVLPLQNMMNDPEQEYFVDGMTEALTAELSKLGALKVIARTSAMRYKQTDKSAREIGHELGVDGLIEGSVLRAGNQVRITAQLINGATEEYLWAQSFDRELTDILALHSDVARAIAREVKVAVTPAEEARLARVGSIDPEAHEFYLKAGFQLEKRNPEALKKALDYFQQAIEKDPGYALAHAGLASSYALLPFYRASEPKVGFLRAKAAALRALELQDTLGEAYATLALVKLYYDWDWKGAESEFQRALELNPNYPSGHQWYGEYLMLLGRYDEALREFQQARELDPLSRINEVQVILVHYFRRQYDRAILQSKKLLEMDPHFPRTHACLGRAYVQRGMYAEAIAAFQEAETLSGHSPEYLSELGHAYAVMGDRTQAQKVLEELRKMSESAYVGARDIGLIYTGLGEKDYALKWLEKAYEERDTMMLYFTADPRFDPLRDDPRFQDLLRRMNFPSP